MRTTLVARAALALLLLGVGALASVVALTFLVALFNSRGSDALVWLALSGASVLGTVLCAYAIRRFRSLAVWKLGLAGVIALVLAWPGYSLLHAFAMNPP